MRLIDRIEAYRWAEGRLTLRSPAGTVVLRPLTDDLIQLTVSDLSSFRPLPTGAIAKTDWTPIQCAFTEGDGQLTLATATVRIEVQLAPFRVSWYRSDRLFARDEAIQVGEEKILVTRQLAPTEAFYGLGEKTGYLNKRGKRDEMWATDQAVSINTDPLYQTIPFFVALRDGEAHGLFVDCGARSFFDLGSRDPATTYTIEVHSRVYDAYVFAAPLIPDVVARYTELTGRMELPALWTLGYHQCRYSYYPEAQVREVAALLREKELPCDAIWLDIHYMDGYRVFTWDPTRFADPAKLIADLGEQGFKVVNIVDPGVKVDPNYPVYTEGLEQGHFAREPSGEVHVGEVWPGPAVYPDFFREATRQWWGDLHKAAYIDLGVAGIWNDMNEPSSFIRNEHGEKTLPYGVLHGEDGRQAPHKDVHNLYALHMTMATHAAFKKYRPDKRPFILSRSGFSGIQRYAAVWGGDDFSWFESLQAQIPLLLSMSISGIPFVGTDVGGFIEDASGELVARWLQFGAFSPFFRMHSAVDTREQNPWSFGPEVEEIARKYINLRYHLLPYWYTVFEEAARTGTPIIRPLVYHYQADELVRSISDQYLVGSSLLVAPVYQPGAQHRLVYLPAGEWFDFWSGARLQGGQHLVAEAPLDVLPLYVRAGAVLPMGPTMPYTGAVRAEQLTLLVYAGSGSFTLYEDAGDGYGPSCRTTIEVTPTSVKVGEPLGDFTPERKRVELVLYGFDGSQVKLDDAEVTATRTECGGLQLVVEQVGGFTVEVCS